MSRSTSSNFSSPSFPIASADADAFDAADVQQLAAAVDAHDHTAGKGVVITTGGGGSSGGDKPLPMTVLDEPPVTPHAKDDEFSGTSLDAKWTNPATSTRTNLIKFNGDGWLLLEPSDTGTASVSTRGGYGIRQAAPTGAFTIMAKIYDWRTGDDSRVGIFVANSTGGTAQMLGSNRQANRFVNAIGLAYSESADWGAYDGYDQPQTSWLPQAYWYRISWNGSGSMISSYSTDGAAWVVLHTRTGQTQPTRIGLGIWANTAGIFADRKLYCSWFRVTEP